MAAQSEQKNKQYWNHDLEYGGLIYDEAKKEMRKLKFASYQEQTST